MILQFANTIVQQLSEPLKVGHQIQERQLVRVARMFNIVQLFSESVDSQLDVLKSVLLLSGKTIYIHIFFFGGGEGGGVGWGGKQKN